MTREEAFKRRYKVLLLPVNNYVAHTSIQTKEYDGYALHFTLLLYVIKQGSVATIIIQ